MNRQSDPVAISVVIPTHNRAAFISPMLGALTRQTLPTSDYEVIVVADGCTDNTVATLRVWSAPFRLLVLEQFPGKGAGSARNLGAGRASGAIILFLDDDMEASPELLREHVASHRAHMAQVVLGYFPMPRSNGEDLFTATAREWWDRQFAARASPLHRYTFRDFCTGNLSIAQSVFQQSGGFYEQVGQAAGEDYELGYRLIRDRVKFRYLPTAFSLHHSTQPLNASLRRAEQEGYGHSLVVKRHPELFWEFNICKLLALNKSSCLRPLWKLLWCRPDVLKVPVFLLRRFVSLCAWHRMDSLALRVYAALRGYYYWRGVQRALGSLSAWERIAQDAPTESKHAALSR